MGAAYIPDSTQKRRCLPTEMMRAAANTRQLSHEASTRNIGTIFGAGDCKEDG